MREVSVPGTSVMVSLARETLERVTAAAVAGSAWARMVMRKSEKARSSRVLQDAATCCLFPVIPFGVDESLLVKQSVGGYSKLF